MNTSLMCSVPQAYFYSFTQSSQHWWIFEKCINSSLKVGIQAESVMYCYISNCPKTLWLKMIAIWLAHDSGGVLVWVSFNWSWLGSCMHLWFIGWLAWGWSVLDGLTHIFGSMSCSFAVNIFAIRQFVVKDKRTNNERGALKDTMKHLKINNKI